MLGLLRGGHHAAVVVRAPAGYGKTTAIAQWLESSRSVRRIWVSLSEDDNDPASFWGAIATGALLAGLREDGLDPDSGATRAGLIVPLIDAFAVAAEEWVLVLDDVHLVTREDTLASLDWFLGRLSGNVTVVCMTRAHLDLPALTRLRARGEVLDLTTDALRLDADETRRALSAAYDLRLVPDELSRVCELTDGWPAAISLIGSAHARGGSHGRALAQHASGAMAIGALVREGLAGHSAADYELLRRMSVLERFTADVLHDVLQNDRAWGVAMDVAEGTGLIAALDDAGQWWRMHHLVREHLLAELGRDDPALRRELHRRAAARFERENELAVTVHHLLGAEDFDIVADILSNVRANSMVPRQALGLSWLDRIPRSALERDPRLAFWEAWACATGGDEARRDSALARGRLAAAAQSIDAFATWDDAEDFVHASACYHDVGAALRAAERFLSRHDAEHPQSQLVRLRQATMLYLAGRCTHALQLLDDLDRGSPLARPLRLLVPAYRALCVLELGDVKASRTEVDRCAVARAAYRLGPDPVYLPAEQARARTLTETGDPARGLAAARAALEVAGQHGDTVLVVPHLLLEVARAEAVLGDRGGAAVAVRQAGELIDGAVDPGALHTRIARLRSRFALPGAGDARHEGLSRRELDVLVLLAGPLSASGIASELFISPNTARSHIKSIHRKLGVGNRADAVRAGRRLGLVTEGAAGASRGRASRP